MTKGTSEGTGVQGRSGRGLTTRIPEHWLQQRVNFLHNRINDQMAVVESGIAWNRTGKAWSG